jgi:glucose-6-phosphate 1-dehydrogenase
VSERLVDHDARDGPWADLTEAFDDLGKGARRRRAVVEPPAVGPLLAVWARIVVEKPFGHDLDSARILNERVHRVFAEEQIFRIDHYLGKETVQNLLVFRFANSMFERVWNRDAIDQVQLTVAESIGVEGRGASYEESGAIRDIVQNHLLQMLAFLAMEPPRSLEPTAIHDEKVKLLQAVRTFRAEDVVRGQYERGKIDGAPVPGYRSEDRVSPESNTETYAGIRARIDNWRWEGGRFFLRTGKRLPRRATEITVVFRDAPAYLFEGEQEQPHPDHLSIRIQPQEGVSFAFEAKQPGPGFTPKTVRMDFDYEDSFTTPGDAYERLLHDAMCGDSTLFTRQDAVERSWQIVGAALGPADEVHGYAAGSWGPRAADQLIAPRHWHLR